MRGFHLLWVIVQSALQPCTTCVCVENKNEFALKIKHSNGKKVDVVCQSGFYSVRPRQLLSKLLYVVTGAAVSIEKRLYFLWNVIRILLGLSKHTRFIQVRLHKLIEEGGNLFVLGLATFHRVSEALSTIHAQWHASLTITHT